MRPAPRAEKEILILHEGSIVINKGSTLAAIPLAEVASMRIRKKDLPLSFLATLVFIGGTLLAVVAIKAAANPSSGMFGEAVWFR